MSKMISTGIPWLPEVAEGFSTGYVKQYFYVSKDLSGEGEPERVLKLARAGIAEKDVTTNEGQMAASYVGYNKVKVGDLLLNPMDLYSGANCNVSELEGVISPAYSNLRVKNAGSVVPKYYDYYFKSQYWLMAMFAHGKGVSFDNRWTLNNDSLRSYEIPVIPYIVQQRIVEKIQSKEKKVDAIIANVQTQIEKLKAYKQSLITEVVTKGLDPTVPMKDSGVEWIGKIPSAWSTIRVKQLLCERKERSFDGSEVPLSMSQKLGLVPTIMLDSIPNVASSFVGAKLAYINDLVFNKLKAHLGVFSVSKYDGLVSPDYAVYYSTGVADLKYLEYLFKTPQCISEFRKKSTGIAAGLTRLYTDGLFSIECPFPAKDEQAQIVEYLNGKCEQIDRLITIKQAKIDKLSEYKKSLIYEYVTGKKEVPVG